MKCDRPGHAVNGEVAENVAALRPGLLYTVTLEGDLRIFFHVKELRAAQVIVSLFDPCIDTAHVNLRRNRGALGMLAVDFYLAVKLCEFPMRGSQELMHIKIDRRPRRIEPVRLVRQYGGTQATNYHGSDKAA